MKEIIIVNGYPRSGKDTFAKLLGDLTPVKKISSIDYVKFIATLCGWEGEKTPEARKFLSDLKFLTSEYNDLSFRTSAEQIIEFCNDKKHDILLIDVREPEEIGRYKYLYNAKTVYIDNKRVEGEQSNEADSRVKEFNYDYVIDNNSSMDNFSHNVKLFKELIYKRKI